MRFIFKTDYEQDLRIVKTLRTEGGLMLVVRKAIGRATRMVKPAWPR